MKGLLFVVLFASLCWACEKKCTVDSENTASGFGVVQAEFSNIEINANMRAEKTFWLRESSQAPTDMRVKVGRNAYDTVDFAQYDVLGYYRTGFCEVAFKRILTDFPEKDSLNFQVSVQECGDCEIRRESMNWVLVEKIDSNYVVGYN